MAPDVILVVAGITTAWAVLGIVGGEHQRVLQRVEAAKTPSDPTTPPDAANAPKATPAPAAAKKAIG
jgi:hypothetical protein